MGVVKLKFFCTRLSDEKTALMMKGAMEVSGTLELHQHRDSFNASGLPASNQTTNVKFQQTKER